MAETQWLSARSRLTCRKDCIVHACVRAREGEDGHARMRTEDGHETDDLATRASAHLAADSATATGSWAGGAHVSAAYVATGRPRDAMGRPVMPTQHRASTLLSQPLAWSHLLAWPGLHNRGEDLSRAGAGAGPGDGGRSGRACRSGMKRSRAGNARGAAPFCFVPVVSRSRP